MRVPARVALVATALAIFSSFLWGQKIETQSHDQKDVVHVETAPDHLTVIELSDTVTMVAIGNPAAFLVERRDNKVLVKPYEEGVSTNLFIWTPVRRYSYELIPASDIARMHFAIDQQPAPRPAAAPPPVPPVPAARAEGPLREMLSAAVPVSVYGKRENTERPQVTIRSLYRHGSRIHLQYEVTNHSRALYQLGVPSVWQLSSVRSKQSLIPLGDVQLGERFSRLLSVGAAQPAKVLSAEQTTHLLAGRSGMGWIELELSHATDRPQVLELQFPPDSHGPVTAFLVLNHREVSDVSSGE